MSEKEIKTILVKNKGKQIVKEIDIAITLLARDYKGLSNWGGNAVMETIKIKNATKKGYLEATVGDGINISNRMIYQRGNVQKGMIQTLDCSGGNSKGVVVMKDNRNMKEMLCDSLIDNNIVKDGDIINHSYTNGLCGKNPNSRQSLDDYVESKNGITPTLTTRSDTSGVTINQPPLRIRKLTPKECWRLMGFDDEDFEKAEKVNSNSQLYKQAGNSIVVNVLEAIIGNINFEESENYQNLVDNIFKNEQYTQMGLDL